MKIKAKIKGVARDYITGRLQITLDMIEGNAGEVNNYADKDLTVEIKQYRKQRSSNANALLWECLGRCADTLGGDKWDYYIRALAKYGQYTMVEMPADAVDRFREIYRECEIVGERDDKKQVLCYYGSSTYNTKDFARLLDGVIEDMKQAGIETPTSEEMQAALDNWERGNNGKKTV